MLAIVFHPLLHSLISLTKPNAQSFHWGSLEDWPSHIFLIPVIFLGHMLNIYNCYSDWWQFHFTDLLFLQLCLKVLFKWFLNFIIMQNFSPDVWKCCFKWFQSKWSTTYWINSLSQPVMANVFIWNQVMSLPKEARPWECLWSKWSGVSACKTAKSTLGDWAKWRTDRALGNYISFPLKNITEPLEVLWLYIWCCWQG